MIDWSRRDALPPTGICLLFAVGLLVAEIVVGVAVGAGASEPQGWREVMRYVGYTGGIAWLACVFTLHGYLEKRTDRAYPISPGKAAWFHLIPVFGIYWMFRWTNQIAHLIGLWPVWLGALVLFGFILVRVDSALGYSVLFGG